MGKTSFLELLEREKHICDRLQVIGNMLFGLDEAARDGRTELQYHQSLIHRCLEENDELEAALKDVRRQMAERVDDLFALAVCGGAK